MSGSGVWGRGKYFRNFNILGIQALPHPKNIYTPTPISQYLQFRLTLILAENHHINGLDNTKLIRILEYNKNKSYEKI
jgi:hypothetical protein